MQEYEETGGKFKINGYFYKFRHESKTGNKYYKCDKMCNAIRCRGSVTISPNGQIIKKVEHTCNPLKIKNKYNPRIVITVEGYSYYFNHQYKNKNIYYSCKKKTTEKCRGSVTLSPNETIVRKQFHTCSGICKKELKSLDEVQEYEETNGKTRINGYFYHLSSVSTTKNKYYKCSKRKSKQKCRGSITITPNREIAKRLTTLATKPRK